MTLGVKEGSLSLMSNSLELSSSAGARRQVLGAAGGGARPQGDRCLHDPLRVELDPGRDHGGAAAAVLAVVRGAEVEQGAHHGRDEVWSGAEGL